MNDYVCPDHLAGELIVDLASRAADALAAGQPKVAEGFADLAFRIRSTDAFNDADEVKQ